MDLAVLVIVSGCVLVILDILFGDDDTKVGR